MSKNALFVSHLGIGDMVVMSGAVRYLSLKYHKIYVVCKDIYYNNMKMMYQDNNNIELMNIDSKNEKESLWKLIQDCEKQEYDIHLSGIHKNKSFHSNDIHKSFYNDLNLDISIMKDYFSIAFNIESINLYKLLEKNMKYVFIHSQSSNKEISIDIQNFKDQNILIINPNKNMYNINDNFFVLANKFINKPLFLYTDVIQHASELHVVDSSFSCIAALMKNFNSSQKKYLYTRQKHSRYNSLFDHTWTYI